MSGGDGIHNEHSGPVQGNVFQIGTVQGDVMLQRNVPADESLAADLAGVVGARSRKEEEHWRIDDPDPLRVRWHTAEEGLFDRSIQQGPQPHNPVPLSGQFTAIRATFQATGSQRLVVLGRAGAGKTVLAHRLILDLLAHRDQHGPVPTLFSLNDWNPTASGLRVWMIDRLVRDHPFLEQRDPTGTRGAEVLVDRDWILPVLDGFDEIPEQHRTEAIRQISQVQVPLVLTSRPDQYALAAQGAKAIGKAAAIEIEDLTRDQAEQYLCGSAGPSRAAGWQAVFQRLHDAPHEAASRNLIPVLTTPLMVMLARTLYNDTDEHDPSELLDTGQFPTSPDLERHLLSGYITTVYDPRRPLHASGEARTVWDHDQARHWLGHLATSLRKRNTHDFTWWQLPALLSHRTRILATMAISGLAFGLAFGLGGVGGLMGGFADEFADGLADGPVVGLAVGITVGLAIGFAVGILNEVRLSHRRTGREPERLRPYRRRRGRQRRYSSRTDLTRAVSEFTNGLAIGVVFGLAVGLAYGLAGGFAAGLAIATGSAPAPAIAAGLAIGLVYGFGGGLEYGLVLGVVFGIANVVVSVLGEEHDPHDSDPWQLLTTDRTVTLIRIVTTGVAGVAIVSLAYAAVPILGKTGLWLVLLLGVLRLALSAWGNWLLFVRLWLPLTGRLPWRPRRFLEDAYDRGILRQAGAAYQFRHAELRDHLADHHLSERTGR